MKYKKENGKYYFQCTESDGGILKKGNWYEIISENSINNAIKQLSRKNKIKRLLE